MLKKLRWPLFAILSCWILNACSSVPVPPDVPACENFTQRLSTDPATGHLILTPSPTCMKQVGEPECGHCVMIISGAEFFVAEAKAHQYNGKPWSTLKAQSIYLPAQESYAPLSKYMIDACDKMGCADNVDQFKVRLGKLQLTK